MTADTATVAPTAATGAQRSARAAWRRLLRHPSGVIGLVLLALFVGVAVGADWLAPMDPFRAAGPPLEPPGGTHLLGTDGLGRDLYSGIVHGARTSLVVTVGVGVLAIVIGGLVGTVSGYYGGTVDDVLMRLTEVFQTLPRFFLAIVALALFGPGLDRLIIVLGLTSWAILARVIRAEVLAIKSREFVEAARAIGASNVRIVRREILPHALPAGLIFLALLLAQVLLIEASLGFLELGDPNAMSWGLLAGQAQRFLRVAWWLSVFPGLAIVLAVLGLNLLGDALTDLWAHRR